MGYVIGKTRKELREKKKLTQKEYVRSVEILLHPQDSGHSPAVESCYLNRRPSSRNRIIRLWSKLWIS